MLKRIKIENLRGIREGEIDGLTRLVVLVGANGSGKSTVLEGTFIGGARHPAAAVGMVTQRRAHTWNGAPWLIRGGNEQTVARVEVEWADETCITRRIQWDSVLLMADANERLSKTRAPGPYSAFRIYREHPPLPSSNESAGKPFALAAMAANNEYVPFDLETDLQLPSLRLVDSAIGQPLHDLFTQARKVVRRDDILECVQTVIPEIEAVEILTENSVPRLFLTFCKGSVFVVPVSLAGDGIHTLLRMAMELASPAGGTVLLEEPEMHMHPKASYAFAKAVVAAVRRNVQVVMSTHSLEIVDLLLSELTDEEVVDPGMMTLQRLRLDDGALRPISIPAVDCTSMAEDLR